MNRNVQEAIAYWLLYEFEIEFHERKNEDAGTSVLRPVHEYYRAMNEYLVQCNKKVQNTDDYENVRQHFLGYRDWFVIIMKGMAPIWRKQITSNSKQSD
jgi:hypothetical protein